MALLKIYITEMGEYLWILRQSLCFVLSFWVLQEIVRNQGTDKWPWAPPSVKTQANETFCTPLKDVVRIQGTVVCKGLLSYDGYDIIIAVRSEILGGEDRGLVLLTPLFMCQEAVWLRAQSGWFLATAGSPWNAICSQCRSAVFFPSGAISLFQFSIFPSPDAWRTTFWEEVFSIYFPKWSESGRNSFTDCFVLWKFHQFSEFMEHRLRAEGLQLCLQHWSLPEPHPSGWMPWVNWFTLNLTWNYQ